MIAFLVALALLAQPAPPSLTISAQPLGAVIQIDGQGVSTAQHLTPDGLVLVGAEASSGAIATEPFMSWKGTPPATLTLRYRVLRPGIHVLRVQAQIEGELLQAETVLHTYGMYLPHM